MASNDLAENDVPQPKTFKKPFPSVKHPWTDELFKSFVDCLVEAKQNQLLESDNGVTSKAWDWIQREFEKRVNLEFSRTQLQSKLSDTKKDYKAVKEMRGASGFGWDDTRKVKHLVFHLVNHHEFVSW